MPKEVLLADDIVIERLLISGLGLIRSEPPLWILVRSARQGCCRDLGASFGGTGGVSTPKTRGFGQGPWDLSGQLSRLSVRSSDSLRGRLPVSYVKLDNNTQNV